MSETATEKEVEVVAGTIKGVIVKGVDKWQIEVQPDGSEYTRKLWTKDKALVEAVPAKIGEAGAFVCHASYWRNNDGKEVRSLWIDRPSDGTEVSTERVDGDQPAAPRDSGKNTGHPPSTIPIPQARSTGSGNEMTKEEWARKDSAIHMMAAIKTAADALKHTLPSEPSDKDLNTFLERCKTLSYNWWQRAEAVRAGDDSDLPF